MSGLERVDCNRQGVKLEEGITLLACINVELEGEGLGGLSRPSGRYSCDC